MRLLHSSNPSNSYAIEPYPAPLAEAGWYGVAGEMVRAIAPHTEADPHALLFQLLVAFGNAGGGAMGYEFAGFFALAEPPVLEDALATWTGCRGRTITEPFHGIGVAVPERALTYGEPPGGGKWARELAYTLEETLVEWSRRYPATRFVFMRAECFGGECQYWGYVCQNGAIQERAKDLDMDHGDALRRLVRALGVNLGEESRYFAPFTRGYFDPTP